MTMTAPAGRSTVDSVRECARHAAQELSHHLHQLPIDTDGVAAFFARWAGGGWSFDSADNPISRWARNLTAFPVYVGDGWFTVGDAEWKVDAALPLPVSAYLSMLDAGWYEG